ncbi:hypothetical protein BgiBS90_022106 [Biomphalaria glabrata]|nr:hypothetical protein BgiBS90_022106 [Biomphalaria glabrata]
MPQFVQDSRSSHTIIHNAMDARTIPNKSGLTTTECQACVPKQENTYSLRPPLQYYTNNDFKTTPRRLTQNKLTYPTLGKKTQQRTPPQGENKQSNDTNIARA